MSALEQARDHYLSRFECFAAERLHEPAWLRSLRWEAAAHFGELGFPHTKLEEWRYTNVAPLAKPPFELCVPGEASAGRSEIEALAFPVFACSLHVFVDGRYEPRLSALGASSDVHVESLAELLARAPEGPGLRYDRGVVSGAQVPVHYDPILGKLVAHAPTRAAAIERMIRGLQECVVLGVQTPVEFLIDVLRSEPFRAGETHTGFIDEYFADWAQDPAGDAMAAIGYVLDQMEGPGAAAATGASAVPDVERFNPWQRLGSWDLEH